MPAVAERQSAVTLMIVLPRVRDVVDVGGERGLDCLVIATKVFVSGGLDYSTLGWVAIRRTSGRP